MTKWLVEKQWKSSSKENQKGTNEIIFFLPVNNQQRTTPTYTSNFHTLIITPHWLKYYRVWSFLWDFYGMVNWNIVLGAACFNIFNIPLIGMSISKCLASTSESQFELLPSHWSVPWLRKWQLKLCSYLTDMHSQGLLRLSSLFFNLVHKF